MKFEIRLHQTNKDTKVIFSTDDRKEAIERYRNEYASIKTNGVETFTRVALYRGAIEIAVFEFDNHLGTTKAVRKSYDGAYFPNDPLKKEMKNPKPIIAIVMEDKGINPAQLSRITGLPYRTIQDYYYGNMSINRASAINVYKIAEALEVKMEDLIEHLEE